MMLPRLLLIFRPCLSLTIGCRNTSLKGSSPPVSARPIITMRATQKKSMSWPVSSSEVG